MAEFNAEISDGTDSSKNPIQDIDLLLIGKTGNGKSATGNTILGRHVFKSLSSMTSVTKRPVLDVGKHNQYVIKVMDTPGVMDTSEILDPIEASKLIMEQMKDAVILNPKGYHAFLMVFKYENRFTKEEVESVNVLKQIFGDDFVKKYCIIIITGGDHFRNKSNGRSFKVWRQEQGGYFKQLRLECQDRVILFDNVTQSAIVRTKQMKKLIKCVRKLNTDGIRYTDKRFQRAKQSRDYLLCENQMVQVDKGLDEVTIILEQYSVIVDDDFSYPSEDLKEISVKCDALFDQFSISQDESSTVKEFLKMVVEVRNSSFKFSQNFKEIHQKLTINSERLKKEFQRINGVLNDFSIEDQAGNTGADDSAGNTRVLADDNQGIKRSKVRGYSDACITTSEGETLRKRSTSVTSGKRVVSSKELKDQVIGEFVDNNAIQKLYATEKELKYQLAAIKNEMKLEIQKYRRSHKLIQEKRDNILRAKSACQIL